jgi:predicted Zn-dependent protease
VEESLLQRIRGHIDAKRWQEAQVSLEALLRLVPEDVTVRMELAKVMLRQGQFRASGLVLLEAAAIST